MHVDVKFHSVQQAGVSFIYGDTMREDTLYGVVYYDVLLWRKFGVAYLKHPLLKTSHS